MELPRLKIGYVEFLPAYVKEKERYTHILLTGKSGTGKSSLLANWWQQDCFYKVAKVLIEPSGFLTKDCYSISRGQARYCSLDNPISINPMAIDYHPNQICDNIAEALNQVIVMTTPNDRLTVKMRGILDEAIKYCLANNRKSLVNVRDYIENMKGSIETRDGIIQRLNFLINDERIRPILCGNNAIEWGKLIANHETFILDCFGMGRDKMIFLGNLVSQGIKNYFRYERPKEYQPLALYIDECQNFVNTNFYDILKEGRKYKLGCILSTQDFASIDDKMARVMLNVGTLIAFQVGHREAELLGKEIHCPPELLQFLEKYHLAFKSGNERGITKAPRPPIFRKFEPEKKAEPQREVKPIWFPLQSYKEI